MKPLYQSIYERIKEDIRNGTLGAKSKLRSKRKMAESLGVSVSTIDGAYGQLMSEGFITSRPKSGYYVCELPELAPSVPYHARGTHGAEDTHDACVDFAINGIDRDGFPYSTWRKLARAAVSEEDESLVSRSPFQGERALREQLARYLYMSRGVRTEPEQIVIGAGTDNLLQMLSYVLAGSCTIAMEDPVYHEAYLFFRRMGHPVRSVPIDDCGLPVESLAGLTDAAVYLTPAHQFPLGITMPISRRIELLNWAGAKSGRYLIEDDYDSEFRYNSKPVPAMKSIDSGGRVIYLGSFSRTISPALRISYMVLPETLIDDYRVCCAPFGCCVSKLDQLVLTRFLAGGHFEGHLNKMRKVYRERRAHLVAALECAFHGRIEIHGICAGQHVPIRISGLSEDELIARARRAGVKIYPISPYFIEGVPRKYAGVVLIGYGTLAEDEIDEGITRLKTVW